MSIMLTQFYSIPNFFKDRKFPDLKSIQLVDIQKNYPMYKPKFFKNANFLNKETANAGFLLTFKISSASELGKQYICKFWLDRETIEPRTICQFYCSCHSFKFEFENILYRLGGSLREPEVDKTPKKNRLSVCKHLISCLYMMRRYRSINDINMRK